MVNFKQYDATDWVTDNDNTYAFQKVKAIRQRNLAGEI